MKYLYLALFTLSFGSFAQEYTVKHVSTAPKIDGKLEPEFWDKLAGLQEFRQYFPNDTIKAKFQTVLKIANDDKFIYVGFVCQTSGNQYSITSLRRDYRAGGNDNVSVIFDTFSDKTNGLLFGLNPLGVMREALLFNGGVDNLFFNESWDNKWLGASHIGDHFWSGEMAIPLSTLRFKPETQNMRLKVYRFDTQANETTSLNQMPQNQIIMHLGYSTPLVFEKVLKKTSKNISIIPYLAGGYSKDYTNASNPNNGPTKGIGGDLKIGVTSGLNLDLTLNPDFSNVEADRQVVNLTRFDINLPEQRQFFVENSDLFSGYGAYSINPFLGPQAGLGGAGNQVFSPFFSRTIGLAKDTITGLNVKNRILYGARLSGKLNDQWRVGLLNSQTEADDQSGIPSTNFTVASVQRQIAERSNIAAIFVNKFSDAVSNPFNRVGGLEFNLGSKNNRWQGKAYSHRSFSMLQKDQAFTHGSSLMYSVSNFTARWAHDFVGKGFEAQAGFVPRTNFLHLNPTAGFSFNPHGKVINRYSIGLALDQYTQPSVGLTDRVVGPFVQLSFTNTTRMLLSFNQNQTFLTSKFDVLRSNGELPSLTENKRYSYRNMVVQLTSNQRKKLWLYTNPTIGQYYDGSLVSMGGVLNYRVQPYAAVAFNFSYNHIEMPYAQNDVFLIGPRLDLTLTKSFFITTFAQYNSQFSNMNLNTRVQWRFAPVSDFFLVYVDNYDTQSWASRNRSLQAKITYWFNV